MLRKLSYLLVLLVTPIVFAQNESGAIEIKLFDSHKARIVKANIIIVSKTNPNFSKSIGSNPKEQFLIEEVPVGNYKIAVEALGFKPYTTDILVKDGTRKILEVVLEVNEVKEVVEIENKKGSLEDPFEIRVIEGDDLAKLPDDPELLARALQEIAGPSITGGDVPITVDGFEGEIPPKEFIREIRFDRSIFSAQYEHVNGGGINIYTKSIAKSFTFGADLGFSDYRFNAGNPLINQKPPEGMVKYSGYILGPLVRNKAVFSIDFRSRSDHLAKPINAVVLESDNSLSFKPLKDFASGNSQSRLLSVTTKGDIFAQHSYYFNFRFSGSQSNGNGVGGLNLQDMNYDSNSNYNEIRISETFFSNSGFINQFRMQAKLGNDVNLGENLGLVVNVLDSFVSGGSPVNNRRTSSSLSFYNDSIYAVKKHDFRFGFYIKTQSREEYIGDNLNGKYTFAGGIAPLLNSENQLIKDENGETILGSVSSLESYRRTLLLSKQGYSPELIRNLGGGPTQFSIAVGDLNLKNRLLNGAIYFQDSFYLNNQILLSFGLRYENQSQLKDKMNFAPRLGFAWAPKSKGNSMLSSLPYLRIGFGTYYKRIDIDTFSNQKRINSSERSEYFVTTPYMLDLFPSIPNNEQLQQLAVSKSVLLLDSKMVAPRSNIFNVSLEKKLSKSESIRIRFTIFDEERKPLSRKINAPIIVDSLTNNSSELYYPLGANAGDVSQIESIGKRTAQIFGISFKSRRNFAVKERVLKFKQPYIAFAYRKTRDNIVNGSGNPFDPYDFSNEMSFGSDDGVYTINSSIGIETILGFNIRAYVEFSNGRRFNIVTGIDSNRDGILNERPSFSPSKNGDLLVDTKYGILNPIPASTSNLIPRNLARGDSAFNIDASLTRGFVLKKRAHNSDRRNISIVFGLYIRNLSNTNNPSSPIGNMLAPNFLESVGLNSELFSVVYNSGSDYSSARPRRLDFSARIFF